MARIEAKRGNGKLVADDAWRWSVNRAVVELKIPDHKVRSGLRRAGISPGLDGKFSTREIFTALNDLSPLERDAKRAVLESKIDEANFQRARRAEIEGRLIPLADVEKYMRDFMVTFVQFIKHSSLSAEEKSSLIDQLGHIIGAKNNGKKKQLNNGQTA